MNVPGECRRANRGLERRAGVSLTVPDNEQLRGDAFMDELDRRIQALMPEDMLDTSDEDAQTAKNFESAKPDES